MDYVGFNKQVNVTKKSVTIFSLDGKFDKLKIPK